MTAAAVGSLLLGVTFYAGVGLVVILAVMVLVLAFDSSVR